MMEDVVLEVLWYGLIEQPDFCIYVAWRRLNIAHSDSIKVVE